jgi:GNAT superfamily N-acetyltransferase
MPAADEILYRPFQSGDERPFRDLNRAWVEQLFGMEERDFQTLDDPIGHVLAPGGHILCATLGTDVVACCALLPMGTGAFELAKMTVMKRFRGRGLGRGILDYAIAYSRSLGARRLYLETNSKLREAIHLYESVGFRHLSPRANSPYARANVFMELSLLTQ